MITHRFEPTGVATSGGVWSDNTASVVDSLCQHVFVKSASNDTTYTLTITDNKSRQVRTYTTTTQSVNDLTPWPAKGKYTIAISAASADESFTVMLCFIE